MDVVTWVYRCGLVLWLGGLLSLSVGSCVDAAPCDQDLTPLSGDVGYMARDNRCEGFYVSPVSAPSLELISLLRGRLHYDLDSPTPLLITAPARRTIQPGPIRVRAVALPLRTYYRMDAVLPEGGQLTWPKHVLSPSRLYAERVGVYGWIGPETEKLFVPLRVFQQGTPPPKTAIEVMLRSAVDLEGLVWRLTVGDSPSPAWQQGEANIPAGQPVTIRLPDGPVTRVRLDVAAKVENRDRWAKLTLRLIRDQP